MILSHVVIGFLCPLYMADRRELWPTYFVFAWSMPSRVLVQCLTSRTHSRACRGINPAHETRFENTKELINERIIAAVALSIATTSSARFSR
jgi:hypothetical protein